MTIVAGLRCLVSEKLAGQQRGKGLRYKWSVYMELGRMMYFGLFSDYRSVIELRLTRTGDRLVSPFHFYRLERLGLVSNKACLTSHSWEEAGKIERFGFDLCPFCYLSYL